MTARCAKTQKTPRRHPIHYTAAFRLLTSIVVCTGGMTFDPSHIAFGFSGNALIS